MSPAMLKRPTIRIHYDDAIRPNTNRLFGPLFGTEANTNRIFGTSLENSHTMHSQAATATTATATWGFMSAYTLRLRIN